MTPWQMLPLEAWALVRNWESLATLAGEITILARIRYLSTNMPWKLSSYRNNHRIVPILIPIPLCTAVTLSVVPLSFPRQRLKQFLKKLLARMKNTMLKIYPHTPQTRTQILNRQLILINVRHTPRNTVISHRPLFALIIRRKALADKWPTIRIRRPIRKKLQDHARSS